MNRRQFLAASGLTAAASAFTDATAASPGATAELFKRTDYTVDGLGLDPIEYSLLLQAHAASGRLEADNYYNGGMVAELEHEFARPGQAAAMFVPTGTLAHHLAVRKLAGSDCASWSRRKAISITTGRLRADVERLEPGAAGRGPERTGAG